MGTSGLFGFYYKGKYYWMYNHWDSYVDGLGINLMTEIVEALEDRTFDTWYQMFDNLIIINYDDKPTIEQIEKFSSFTNSTIDSKSINDWHCLLNKCEGSFLKVLQSGFIVNNDNEDPYNDPRMYPYTYCLNMDNRTFIYNQEIAFELNTLSSIIKTTKKMSIK